MGEPQSDEDGYGFATEAADDVDQKALGKIILDQYSVTAMDDVTDGGTAVERTNLALGHDVTDEDTGTVVPDVTDGNTDTGWTQTGKTDATLVVDLDGTYSITARHHPAADRGRLPAALRDRGLERLGMGRDRPQ